MLLRNEKYKLDGCALDVLECESPRLLLVVEFIHQDGVAWLLVGYLSNHWTCVESSKL